MTTMVKAFASLTHRKKHKKKAGNKQSLCEDITPSTQETRMPGGNDCPKGQGTVHALMGEAITTIRKRTSRGIRRRKNRALTETEFTGCILCYLDNQSSLDKVNDLQHDPATSPFQPLHKTAESVAAATTSTHLFSSVAAAASAAVAHTTCRACVCHTASFRRVVPLPRSLQPYWSLEGTANPPDYPQLRRVRFVSTDSTENPASLVQVLPQGQENDDDMIDDEDDDDAILNDDLSSIGTTPSSSWDNLLRSLKTDRRRMHNFALSGNNFEADILPGLLLLDSRDEHEQQDERQSPLTNTNRIIPPSA